MTLDERVVRGLFIYVYSIFKGTTSSASVTLRLGAWGWLQANLSDSRQLLSIGNYLSSSLTIH